MKRVLSAAVLVALSGPALAQSGGGYTVQRLGQPPTTVTPNGFGGYAVQQLGQPPTTVTPNGFGGYTIAQPGQRPAYVAPAPGGVQWNEPYR